MISKIDRDVVARWVFFMSALILAFLYGVAATKLNIFPAPLILSAKGAADYLLEQWGGRTAWYYHSTDQREQVVVHAPEQVAPGLTLIGELGTDEKSHVKVVDERGRVIHSWRIDWYEMWPDPAHLPAEVVPKTAPSEIHGVKLASNGDLIFNFEKLGMVRLDPCGQIVWRLPHRTHHSIHIDENGHIWTSGLITRQSPQPLLPNYAPPFEEFTILEVTPDGQIVRELPVAKLLIDNDLHGLLYMGTTNNRSTKVTDDTLHVNDVEVFPSWRAPGVFRAGDIMISLRNINAIAVFDPSTLRIKFLSIGRVLRQHDPEFLDGNTITVFDNNNLAVWHGDGALPDPAGHYSRVVAISAKTGDSEVRFSGSKEQPFFTDIMGKHQWLSNGNLLLTEAVAGRVVEVNPQGRIISEYFNLQGDGVVALVDDAVRLPPEFDEAFFANAVAACRTETN